MPEKLYKVDLNLDANTLKNVGNINDNDGNTIYNATSNLVERGVLPEYATNSVSSNTSTNGNELIFVDTSSSTITVTLSSSDANTGNEVIVADAGSNAGTNNITIDTESSETIDGSASITIDTDNNARRFVSDGSNWFTASEVESAVGSAIVLDLGDDGTNESSDLTEIATDNDRNSSFTEPSADKLLVEPYKIGAPEGYLQHDGLVISNNGTDGDHDIDTVGGAVGVHDFSGNWRVVELPDETPAFQIDGTSGTAGALINGSSLTADTWYELGIIADSSGSNNPAVVGYTDANRPTASGDLPSGYDLFRAMGTRGKTWWVRTDGSSNIRAFNHFSNGSYKFTQSERETIGILLNDTNPTTGSSVTQSVSTFVPPGKYKIKVHALNNGVSSASNRFGISNETISDENFAEIVFESGDDDDNIRGTDSLIISGQNLEYYLANSEQFTIYTIPEIKAVG